MAAPLRSTDLSEHIFSIPPVYNSIFSHLPPQELYKAAVTNQLLHTAVTDFHSLAYNVNRHLSRFFQDPLAFRRLQYKLGFLVSGSNALQFLDRAYYTNSGLDIFAYPEHAIEIGEYLMQCEAYQFTPGTGQAVPFSQQRMVPRAQGWRPLGWSRDNIYASNVNGVFSFRRVGDEADVKVFIAKISPLDCILHFHSTCIMNFFTHAAAYSLYPRMTFDKRMSLPFKPARNNTADAYAKYGARGWAYLHDFDPATVDKLQSSIIYDQHRYVGDCHTWKITFDTLELALDDIPCFRNRFSTNTLHCNSWRLLWNDEIIYKRQRVIPAYSVYQSADLEEAYLIDSWRLRNLPRAFEEHVQTAKLSMSGGSNEPKLDCVLPSLIHDLN